eukprot:scaffold133681_cov19-Tisochrysis_lutea.AAC.2
MSASSSPRPSSTRRLPPSSASRASAHLPIELKCSYWRLPRPKVAYERLESKPAGRSTSFAHL